MTQIALILGPTGRFGRHMKAALTAHGWLTRSFDRKTDNLQRVSRGVDAIVYGWNPPYPDWHKQCLGQLQQVIAAAKANDATILFPGNIYPYGETMPPILRDDTPHAATNMLGKLRHDMESLLQSSGAKTILLRAGDFIDTTASGNWFDLIITNKTAKTGQISYPGNPEMAHGWAYLPDYAANFALLANMRADLPRYCSLNYAGITLSGNDLAAALGVEMSKMNWLPFQFARPFWPMAKHLLELRFQWNRPHQLDDSGLRALIPDPVETPLKAALASAVSFQIDPHQPMIRTDATV